MEGLIPEDYSVHLLSHELKYLDYTLLYQAYGKWKKLRFKDDISKRENMEYDKETDSYTCHRMKKLYPIYIYKQKSESGYESEISMYESFHTSGGSIRGTEK
nr:hypothetical protein [Anaerocolumna sp.]